MLGPDAGPGRGQPPPDQPGPEKQARGLTAAWRRQVDGNAGPTGAGWVHAPEKLQKLAETVKNHP